MPQSIRTLLGCATALVAVTALAARAAPEEKWQVALTSTSGLALQGTQASVVTHNGQRAVRLVEEPGVQREPYAVVSGPALRDGTIEVDLAGRPGQGANEGARGFVGMAFRVKADQSAFECFYLRPTNGRADDQLRRNHSTQYMSQPDYPWERLREENPGVYESYADVFPGAWTKMRIVVEGTRARLFVNGADQPCLIVNDLKLGNS